MDKLIFIIAVLLVGGCVSIVPISNQASEELKRVGIGYGIVVGVVPADSDEVKQLCRTGKVVESFQQYCENLNAFDVVTVNVAATSSKSFFKNTLVIARANHIVIGNIVKFRFEDKGGFISIASDKERPGCGWSGSPAWATGYPGREGGIECDGWSYKSVLEINWRNG